VLCRQRRLEPSAEVPLDELVQRRRRVHHQLPIDELDVRPLRTGEVVVEGDRSRRAWPSCPTLIAAS
jgi:hypothetical protein